MLRRIAQRIFWAAVFLASTSLFWNYRGIHSTNPRTEMNPLHLEGKLFNIDEKDLMAERVQRVHAICERIDSVSKQMNEVSGIKSVNMSYCAVQKAGTTMWVRIMIFMAGYNIQTGNPMKLSKFQIHYTQSMLKPALKHNGNDINFIKKSLRIMTVRDPYTRLWSAYIDKFVLPDFWKTKGRHIVRMIRKHPDRMSLICGHDVTFQEFIQYVIQIGHNFSYLNQDKHWLPASDLCDPCVFKPDIIGKQETFIADMKYSLRQLKREDIITEIEGVRHTDFEIKDEIDYNFHIFPKMKQCISKHNSLKRMWHAFTLNGYLPSSEIFPAINSIDSLNAEGFFKIIQRVRQKYNETNQEKSVRRRDSMITAFRLLKREQIQRLQVLYSQDFSMFDYESNPTFLNTE